MAECKLCDDRGWFLSVNEDGLCKDCQPMFYHELEERVRVLTQSQSIIDKSNNLDTILSRLDVGIEHLQALRRFEDRYIPTIQPPPSRVVENWRRHKQDATKEAIENDLVVAREKSSNAKTFSGRVNPFNKVLERLTKYQVQLDDITELERLEQRIKHEVAEVTVAHYCEQAEKAEFKSQNKKALDQYLEALYAVRHDPVPDDQQRPTIERIEAKIKELGGKVPG